MKAWQERKPSRWTYDPDRCLLCGESVLGLPTKYSASKHGVAAAHAACLTTVLMRINRHPAG